MPVFLLRFTYAQRRLSKRSGIFGLDEREGLQFTKVAVFPHRSKVSVEVVAESILVDQEVKFPMPVAVFSDVFLALLWGYLRGTDFKL